MLRDVRVYNTECGECTYTYEATTMLCSVSYYQQTVPFPDRIV